MSGANGDPVAICANGINCANGDNGTNDVNGDNRDYGTNGTNGDNGNNGATEWHPAEVQSEPHLPSDVVLGQLVTERIGLENGIVLSFSS